MHDFEEREVNWKRPNFFVRMYNKLVMWYTMRKMKKDDPFIYEDEGDE